MAEAVFRDLVRQKGLESKVQVDSAGIGEWHVGKPPHQGTCKVLSEHNITYDNIYARQVSREDLHKFDLIIVMDKKNLSTIHGMIGESNVPIYLLTDFISGSNKSEIQDPFHSGDFEEVFHLIKLGCHGLLDYILSKNNNRDD